MLLIGPYYRLFYSVSVFSVARSSQEARYIMTRVSSAVTIIPSLSIADHRSKNDCRLNMSKPDKIRRGTSVQEAGRQEGRRRVERQRGEMSNQGRQLRHFPPDSPGCHGNKSILFALPSVLIISLLQISGNYLHF